MYLSRHEGLVLGISLVMGAGDGKQIDRVVLFKSVLSKPTRCGDAGLKQFVYKTGIT